MNIADKQRLWTKYYLSDFGERDSFYSLSTFARVEASSPLIPQKVIEQRARKILRYMLKYLPRDQIIKKYSSSRGHFIRINPESNKTKNQIIERLLKTVWR